MEIQVDNMKISIESSKSSNNLKIAGIVILAGLGAAGFVAAGGPVGIQGMYNGATAAGKSADRMLKVGDFFTKINPAEKALGKTIAMGQGAVAGRQAALNGAGKLGQQLAGKSAIWSGVRITK